MFYGVYQSRLAIE